MILAQAGRFGGWSLYLKDGKPTYTYNFLGLQRYTVAATQALPAGKATIRFEFAYDGGGLGKGGTGTIFVNGKKVAEGTDRPHAVLLSSRRTKAPTSARMRARRSPRTTRCRIKFTGKIRKVTIELKEMKAANAETEQQSMREAHARKQAAD